MTRTLHLVDVFTDRPCAGNPLAVVTGAQGLTAARMQAFAREMNFSETTFVTADAPVKGLWPVRIFTPRGELPFAGHPTLGTAHVIRHALLGGRPARLTLGLKLGPIPVVHEVEGGRALYWMRQNAPSFGARRTRRDLASVLGLAIAELGEQPIEEVSTGVPFLIVSVRTRRALERVRVDREAMAKLVAGLDAKGVLAFAKGAKGAGHELTARVFVEHYGVPEDPATGSASAALGAFMTTLTHGSAVAAEERHLLVEQGVEMGRRSLIRLAVRTSNGVFDHVEITGSSMLVMRGQLAL